MQDSTRRLVKVAVRGDERPVSFELWGKEIAVAEILDQWLAIDHKYFKLRGDDGAVYILRYDERRREWELTFFSKITEGY